jgi:hypothetical protein
MLSTFLMSAMTLSQEAVTVPLWVGVKTTQKAFTDGTAQSHRSSQSCLLAHDSSPRILVLQFLLRMAPEAASKA